MTLKTSITTGGKGHLLALIAGALFPLGLAPLSWWPVIPVSLALLLLVLEGQTPRQSFRRAWLYGVGFNGVGVSWVYVSIHYFGHTPMWLALIATALFVAFLALVFFALPFWLYSKLKLDRYPLLTFPALWVLVEWSKIWFLSGFPWLWAGYGFIDTPLAGLAPVTGVLGISLVAAVTAVCLRQFLDRDKGLPWQPVVIVALLWGRLRPATTGMDAAGSEKDPESRAAAGQHRPGQEVGSEIPRQHPAHLQAADRAILGCGSDPVAGSGLSGVLSRSTALHYQSGHPRPREKVSIVSGVPYWEWVNEQSRFYNSIFVIGNGEGLYHKQKLVPFGNTCRWNP
ncbi:MAG: hypothetical protein R3F38_20020 [Gammaproteobacteria bacterium]